MSSVSLSILKGVAKIYPNKKTQGQERDYLTMLLCLIRFNEPYNTDLLMTLNIPDEHTESGEASQAEEPGHSDQYLDYVKKCEQDFNLLMQTFETDDHRIKALLGL